MNAKKAVHKHERTMHPGKPLTNMAKVMNQRSSGRGR